MTTWNEQGRTEKGADPTKVHLTGKVAAQFPAGETRMQIYDVRTAGFGLRIEPNNRRSYFWCRKIQGRPLFKNIGLVSDVNAEKARATCEEWNGKLSEWRRHNYEGENPFQTSRGEITFGEAVDLYIQKRVNGFAAHPETAAANVSWMIDKYVCDWKPRKLGAIRDRDVRDRHAKLGEHTPSQANRVAQCIRRIYNFAIEEQVFSGQN